MTFRRSLSWSTAMPDIRNDRAPAAAVSPMFLASMARARALDARRAAQARPLVVNGAYDRSAIMQVAIAAARVDRARGVSLPWSQLLASALRTAWARAKAQRSSH